MAAEKHPWQTCSFPCVDPGLKDPSCLLNGSSLFALSECAQTWEGPHVTETAEATSAAADPASAKAPAKKKAGGLNSMLLPELKQLAGSLGIKGITGMRKSALIEAISATQSGDITTPPTLDSPGTSRAKEGVVVPMPTRPK